MNNVQPPAGTHVGSGRALILIVEEEAFIGQFLSRKLADLGYSCECCRRGSEALELLRSRRFDLVLADAMMPEMTCSVFLKKTLHQCPDIAIIMAASHVAVDTAVDSLKDGAYDWIAKPFAMEEVVLAIGRALEKRRLIIENRNYQQNLEAQAAGRAVELEEALRVLECTYHSTLVALSRALDSREADSDRSSIRITVYAKRLARQLGLNEPEMRIIEQGALLHDIGKIGIPDYLLKKIEGFTAEEEALLSKHPEIGNRVLSSIKFLTGAARLVLHHHERYDGEGYPLGLQGEEIDRGARIFSVANAFEELTSAVPPDNDDGFAVAIEAISAMAGNRLDPWIVAEFLNIPVSDWKRIHDEITAAPNPSDLLL